MTGLKASPAAYIARRMATPAGRRDVRRWAWALLVAAGFAAFAASAARGGHLELDPQAWETAIDQIQAKDPGDETRRCALTATTALWALFAPLAATTVVRRRPWRPHSGGLHLSYPVWDLPRPRPKAPAHATHAPPIADRPPTAPNAAATADRPQTPDKPPTARPAGEQAQPHDTAPEPATAPPGPPGPADGQPATPPGEADATTAPTAQPATAQQAPATQPTHDELLARAEAIKHRHGLVFNLFAPNPALKQARESLLAVLVAAGQSRAETAEVSRILRVDIEKVRSLLRRAEKDGWTTRAGRAKWQIAAQAATDLSLLVNAIEQHDHANAEALATAIGPPLPSLSDAWLDEIIVEPTPRQELRTAAADTLVTAGERWPDNPAWLQATDRLYSDA